MKECSISTSKDEVVNLPSSEFMMFREVLGLTRHKTVFLKMKWKSKTPGGCSLKHEDQGAHDSAIVMRKRVVVGVTSLSLPILHTYEEW